MMQQDWDGGAYELERRDGILVLKRLHYQDGYSGSYCGDGNGVYHRTYYFDREFQF